MKPHWQDLLIKKLIARRAAPFYIVRAANLDAEAKAALSNWRDKFVEDYLMAALKVERSQAREKSAFGHLDILSLDQKEDGSAYKEEELAEFFQVSIFCHHRVAAKINFCGRYRVHPRKAGQ